MYKLYEYTVNHSFRYFKNSNVLRIYLDGDEVDSCIPSKPLFVHTIYDFTNEELEEMGIEPTENQNLLIVKI